MNWEILLKALGVVITAVLGIGQLLARLPKSRATLKQDLQLLKLLDQTNPQRLVIERHVHQKIAEIYGDGRERRMPGALAVRQWGDFLAGVVFLFIGVAWGLYLYKHDPSWWLLLPGFMALAGLGGILTGFEDQAPQSQPV